MAAYHQKPALVRFLLGNGAHVDHISPQYGALIYATLAGLLTLGSGAAPCRSQPGPISLYDMLPEKPTLDCPLREPGDLLLYLNPQRGLEKGLTEEMVKDLLDAGAEIMSEPSALGVTLHLASNAGSLSIL